VFFLQKNKVMKRLLIYLSVLFIISCQSNHDDKFFIIEGKANPDLEDVTIELHKVDKGITHLIAMSKINETRDFGFKIPATTPGLYTMHLKYTSKQMGEREHHITQRKHWRFYLGGGDFVNVNVAKKEYELVKGNVENLKLTEWNHMADSLFQLSWKDMPTFKEYFPLMEKFIPECKAKKAELQTSDIEFNKLINMLVNVDIDDLPLDFLSSGNTIHPKPSDFTPHINSIIDQSKLQDTYVLNHPRGLRHIETYSGLGVRINDSIINLQNYIKNKLKYIPNDTLKGHLLASSLRHFKCYDDKYIDFMNNYKKYFVTNELKDKIKTFEESIALSGKGSIAYDFSATDIKGKEYKLSDFKGKLVYIDIWATWCAPCKAEIPHLKKIEKKYQGKDITFIKLSFDSDKKAWEEFVNEHNAKGFSLHMKNDFQSELAKLYKIGSIPRFILVDKEGKIISTDAPRPSETALENMINALL